MPVDLGTANAARRAADLTWALLREPFSRERVLATLAEHGEPEPIMLGDPEVAALRSAAEQLVEVFRATTLDEAAARLNALLAGHAAPPRLSAHPTAPHRTSTSTAPTTPRGTSGSSPRRVSPSPPS
jgi:hypothetical protein